MIDNVVTALSDVAKLPDATLQATQLEKTLRGAVSVVGLPSRISVEFDFPEDLPDVLVDESQIVIAFKNLIRNARDAMAGEGKLAIGATTTDNSVSFHVTDTGTGISAENLEKILEPLFTTKARGMGLGLSISRAIVEKNKGQLSVESEVGKGSCFTITLRR